jgi:hypothetical protein
MTGRPANTLADWFAGGHTHQLAGLLCLLERLPAEVRHRVVDECCRVYPTLAHPRIAHDLHAIDALSTLAEKAMGLSVVEGPEHIRTFVLTALGHAFAQRNPIAGALVGLDVHPATEFVPVPGVTYLQCSISSAATKALVENSWDDIRNRGARCALLNGVASLSARLLAEAVEASKSLHVMVADRFVGETDRLWRRANGPIHQVRVAPSRENPQWIQIQVSCV